MIVAGMSNIANYIENYIKCLVDASPNASINLQRKELAERFKCVPSQINYVLSTRFTIQRGYLVKSKRGGGGYLHIRRLDLGSGKVAEIIEISSNLVKNGISPCEAAAFIDRLFEDRLITRRERQLLKAAVHYVYPTNNEDQQKLRAGILVNMLEALLHDI